MSAHPLQAQIERLKQALEIHRQALEGLESALLELEEGLIGEASIRPQERKGLQLLSIAEACQDLGMSKTWVYQRIRSGEIPSVKLGHNIKIRREDLEEYIETHTYHSPSEEVVVPEEGGDEEDQPLP